MMLTEFKLKVQVNICLVSLYLYLPRAVNRERDAGTMMVTEVKLSKLNIFKLKARVNIHITLYMYLPLEERE